MTATATFRQMKDGTREEYLLLERYEHDYIATLPERVVEAVVKLGTGLGGYAVSRLTHSLQAATRARRDGADIELVVAALIHDVGDELAPYNHAEVAAGLIRPYVRPEVTWIVEQHALFQSYYFNHHYGKDRHGRERFRGHRWFDACEAFCERWDQASFDPDYDADSLESFIPLVREVFLRPAFDPTFVGTDKD
jgi:predicted HD phosphohydrolase